MFEIMRSKIRASLLRRGALNYLYKHIGGMLFRSIYSHTPLFQHVIIQTNYKCTRKCDFCYYGIEKTKEFNDEMDPKLFRRIIDQLATLEYSGRISLFEINEPLTDGRIFEFLNYASTRIKNAWFYMCSNGDLVNPEVITRLFKNGLDQLDICSYDETAKKRIGSLLCQIDRKKYHVRHILRIDNQFISSNRGGNVKKYFAGSIVNDLFCDRIFKILYIKPAGDVPACFEDLFGENIMGNAWDQTILDVWYGKKYEALRSRLKNGDRSLSNICRRCNYIGFGGHYKIPKSLHDKKNQAV